MHQKNTALTSTMVTFNLNGRNITAPSDRTLLQTAEDHGIDVPRLCYMEGMRPDGNCRTCMVEIKGERVLAASCCRYPKDGMEVTTNSDRAVTSQKMSIELLLSDGQTIDAALPKAERAARGGDKDMISRVAVLKKCLEQLAKDEPLRKVEWDKDERRIIASYGLLSAKPILYVANVDESDLQGEGELVTAVREFASKVGAGVVPVCAKLEAEIAELDEADRTEMLESSGLAEPALTVLARAAYRVLGLSSYFTAGEMEVRAWTFPNGATAPEAAGVIHTDFEKGFIRAEVYTLPDLETYKSEKEIRAAGKLRVEGKAYIMQDGDICHFLVNN